MSMDFRGDPSAALLEVLDPEQNHAFVDHYLDVEYDLSQGHVHRHGQRRSTRSRRPLHDRMEVIELSGYTHQEKLAIARQFLVPKQLRGERARRTTQIEFRTTTRPARSSRATRARRACATSSARSASRLPQGRPQGRRRASVETPVRVTPEDLKDFLGKAKFRTRRRATESEIGVATGLAWTEVGGEILIDRGEPAARARAS